MPNCCRVKRLKLQRNFVNHVFVRRINQHHAHYLFGVMMRIEPDGITTEGMPNQQIGAGNISDGEQLVQLFNQRGAGTVWMERRVTEVDPKIRTGG